jgi:hypothetical protein
MISANNNHAYNIDQKECTVDCVQSIEVIHSEELELECIETPV